MKVCIYCYIDLIITIYRITYPYPKSFSAMAPCSYFDQYWLAMFPLLMPGMPPLPLLAARAMGWWGLLLWLLHCIDSDDSDIPAD